MGGNSNGSRREGDAINLIEVLEQQATTMQRSRDRQGLPKSALKVGGLNGQIEPVVAWSERLAPFLNTPTAYVIFIRDLG
ncbi:hypothetical protein QCE63_16720 [Caballeronia sp. LZ065]|uniref:hypothetical protein n=1 Tax=Caballeronia sp. LZ065 TaxID=3038571 RepID=UPI002864B397|nr:hypothetical protein [Caballeronia sp. LZ065]MDR5781068.1 hypothetical protein [Caballeronia sp. LZ065]